MQNTHVVKFLKGMVFTGALAIGITAFGGTSEASVIPENPPMKIGDIESKKEQGIQKENKSSLINIGIESSLLKPITGDVNIDVAGKYEVETADGTKKESALVSADLKGSEILGDTHVGVIEDKHVKTDNYEYNYKGVANVNVKESIVGDAHVGVIEEEKVETDEYSWERSGVVVVETKDTPIVGDLNTGVAVKENYVDKTAEKEDPVDPQDPVDPVDPVDPQDPVDPVDPVDPQDPVDPVDPVDPQDPVDPVDPVDPQDPVDPVDPVDPQDPVDPVDPVDPQDPVDPVDPVDPQDPVDPVDPVDPQDPVDPVDPVDPQDPVDPVDPVDPQDPVDPVIPVNPLDPVDPVVPVNSQKPVEPTKTVIPKDPIELIQGPEKKVVPTEKAKNNVKQVEQEAKGNQVSKEQNGKVLPSTATNMYTYGLVGLLAILAGLFARMRRILE